MKSVWGERKFLDYCYVRDCGDKIPNYSHITVHQQMFKPPVKHCWCYYYY